MSSEAPGLVVDVLLGPVEPILHLVQIMMENLPVFFGLLANHSHPSDFFFFFFKTTVLTFPWGLTAASHHCGMLHGYQGALSRASD